MCGKLSAFDCMQLFIKSAMLNIRLEKRSDTSRLSRELKLTQVHRMLSSLSRELKLMRVHRMSTPIDGQDNYYNMKSRNAPLVVTRSNYPLEH